METRAGSGFLRFLTLVPLTCGPELLGCCERQLCGHWEQGVWPCVPVGTLGGFTEEAKGPVGRGAVSLGWSPGPQLHIRH